MDSRQRALEEIELGLDIVKRLRDGRMRTPEELLLEGTARGVKVLLEEQSMAIQEATEDQGCENSSTGHCVYNIEDDPAQDHCLVCGQPRERK